MGFSQRPSQKRVVSLGRSPYERLTSKVLRDEQKVCQRWTSLFLLRGLLLVVRGEKAPLVLR